MTLALAFAGSSSFAATFPTRSFAAAAPLAAFSPTPAGPLSAALWACLSATAAGQILLEECTNTGSSSPWGVKGCKAESGQSTGCLWVYSLHSPV